LVIGNGTLVHFWEYVWLGEAPLNIYPIFGPLARWLVPIFNLWVGYYLEVTKERRRWRWL